MQSPHTALSPLRTRTHTHTQMVCYYNKVEYFVGISRRRRLLFPLTQSMTSKRVLSESK